MGKDFRSPGEEDTSSIPSWLQGHQEEGAQPNLGAGKEAKEKEDRLGNWKNLD